MKKTLLSIVFLLSLGVTHQAHAQTQLSDSLIAYYPFNGNANDYSGHTRNGTVYGATLTADRNGKPNSAYQFNGVSNYINVPTLTNKLTGGEFSISFWAYTDVTMPGFTFLLSADDPANRFCISVYYPLHNYSPPLNTIFDYGDISNNGRLNTYSSPPISAWSHFTFVCSKSNKKMYYYLDGVPTDSTYFDSDITPVPGRSLRIGGGIGSDGNPYYFQGKLDDIKMFNRAITPKEVIAIYNGASVTTSAITYLATNSRSINIYPSPASDVLHLEMGNTAIEGTVVYNQMGMKMYEKTGILGDIDVSKWAAGPYIIGFIYKGNIVERRPFIVTPR